ncbi:MAG: type restriction enzyme EcoKI subunit [Gemmatimonadetes bacterium]|nr:type restriction enzyme EcoKI subunit [Gemmatimonadota bacterium]
MIGTSTAALLGQLGKGRTAPATLASLLVDRRAVSLLETRTTREEVLRALPQIEAETLAAEIGLAKRGGAVWDALCARAFRRGTAERDALFAFFEVPLPNAPDVEHAESQILCEPRYPVYPYQRLAADEATAYLRSAAPRVLLHMPTGSGKTRTAMNVVSSALRHLPPDSVVLWLAHSEELCDQAAGEFRRAWSSLGDRPVTVARHYGSHRIAVGQLEGSFVVAGLAKVAAGLQREQAEYLQLKRRLRLIVIDEAHKATARSYRHILELLAPAFSGVGILGLSATPGRTWLDADEDAELSAFFERQKVVLRTPGEGTPVEYLQNEGYLAVPEYEYLRYDPEMDIPAAALQAVREGFDLTEDVVRRLVVEEGRNVLLLEAVLREAAKGDKMLVFAGSVEHAELLANVLVLLGYRCAAVSATTPPAARQLAIDAFRSDEPGSLQILTNYGVLTTGFDAPNARVAIIARPTQSVVLYSQMIGRVIRGPRSGGNATCRVVTIVDRLPGFRSIYEGFSHWEDVW